MVLCAGSKQDRVVLVYTREMLMAKTKAKSPNIKYWLVMYPTKNTFCNHIFECLQMLILIQKVYVGKKNLKTHILIS